MHSLTASPICHYVIYFVCQSAGMKLSSVRRACVYIKNWLVMDKGTVWTERTNQLMMHLLHKVRYLVNFTKIGLIFFTVFVFMIQCTFPICHRTRRRRKTAPKLRYGFDGFSWSNCWINDDDSDLIFVFFFIAEHTSPKDGTYVVVLVCATLQFSLSPSWPKDKSVWGPTVQGQIASDQISGF